MERVLADTTLTPASFYFSFYVLEALRKAGLGDRYIERLAPWQVMLKLGLTSAPENPEPTRSDTHAWAAHPNYGLLATVLGVRHRARDSAPSASRRRSALWSNVTRRLAHRMSAVRTAHTAGFTKS